MFMGEADKLAKLRLRREREAAACEFEPVYMVTHRLENVAWILWAHGAVIRAPNLSDGFRAWLRRYRIMAGEAKAIVCILKCNTTLLRFGSCCGQEPDRRLSLKWLIE
jgi:hypothetical protein